ncbi:MAG: hypothetical protein QOJ53_203 [Sphingomonadales bacterium]|jgi:uncharacterized phiE125 gp8 family phage protein|nr:hypothetical protein [Sphingomonadales bacterium]
MSIVIAQPPAAPIALAELKAYLRIATSDEDALLAALVRAAADTCEAFTGRALIVRALEEVLPAPARWTRLGAMPVAAIDGVAALAADGAPAALPAGDYAVDIDAAGEGWVRLLRSIDEKRIRVAYQAGIAADPNGLPEALRHGIVRLAAHLYGHRDADAAPPAAVTALWRPWRRLRLS